MGKNKEHTTIKLRGLWRHLASIVLAVQSFARVPARFTTRLPSLHPASFFGAGLLGSRHCPSRTIAVIALAISPLLDSSPRVAIGSRAVDLGTGLLVPRRRPAARPPFASERPRPGWGMIPSHQPSGMIMECSDLQRARARFGSSSFGCFNEHYTPCFQSSLVQAVTLTSCSQGPLSKHFNMSPIVLGHHIVVR